MRYQGPADNFMVGDKTYHPGDNVPISKEMARHMGQVVNGGHLFEGIEPEQRDTTSDIATARARAEADKA